VIFALVGYAFSGGVRDFTSRSVTVAAKYEIYSQHQHAEQARDLLAKFGLRSG
jgi:hypothetical protein